MRQFGVRMKFKTLFMSDEEKQSYHFDLLLFFNTVVPPNTANDRTDKKWQYSETGDERGARAE